MKKQVIFLWLSILMFCLLLIGCNFPSSQQATATPGMNATQAYQTVIAKVTEAFLLTDSPEENAVTPVSTEGIVPSETVSPSNTVAPSVQTAVPSPTQSTCDRAAAGNPIDITTPDDTELQPGETFTKIWRIQNAGLCTWTTGYAAVWFSGERLGAAESVPLVGEVPPGQTVDIAVEMTAPESPGTYQSNWKLRNDSGVLFAIGPNGESPFWVRIIVVSMTGTPEITTTPTPTSTMTPTSTPTPVVHASGSAELTLDNAVDLDNIQVNTGTEEDVIYYTGEDGNHLLGPQGRTLMGFFGNSQPSLENCKAASLSTASIAVESLSVGTYLCHRSGQGRFGWIQIADFDNTDFTLSVSILTWAFEE